MKPCETLKLVIFSICRNSEPSKVFLLTVVRFIKSYQWVHFWRGSIFLGGRKFLWNLSQGSGNLRYLIGIVAVTIFADDGGAEFSSVSAAMFTAFRCFTDGCAATDGTPLQELLLQSGTLLDIYCSCKWSYTPYKWPYKWATAVMTPKNGVT